MPNFKIETPVATFSGERLGVQIKNGRGETDNVAIAREAKRRGYFVSPDPDKPKRKKTPAE